VDGFPLGLQARSLLSPCSPLALSLTFVLDKELLQNSASTHAFIKILLPLAICLAGLNKPLSSPSFKLFFPIVEPHFFLDALVPFFWRAAPLPRRRSSFWRTLHFSLNYSHPLLSRLLIGRFFPLLFPRCPHFHVYYPKTILLSIRNSCLMALLKTADS